MAYGINTQMLSISIEGKQDLSRHLKWIEQRRVSEPKYHLITPLPLEILDSSARTYDPIKISQPPISSVNASIVSPAPNDVVLGRGQTYRRHPGNVRYRALIDSNFERFEAAGQYDKLAVADIVLHEILVNGGKFLKQEQGDFVEATKEEARRRVCHAFRNRRNKQTPESKSQPPRSRNDAELMAKTSVLSNMADMYQESLREKSEGGACLPKGCW